MKILSFLVSIFICSIVYSSEVLVDFYVTSSSKNKPAMKLKTAKRQVKYLNKIYKDGGIQFRLGEFNVLNGSESEGMHEGLDPVRDLYEISDNFGSNKAINIFVTKNLASNLFGIANEIYLPLGGNQNPMVLMSNGFHLTGGFLLAHEVGHLLGFEHTSDTYSARVNEFQECRKIRKVRYPTFYQKGFWDLKKAADVEKYKYKDWLPKKNIMTRPNLLNYVNFSGPKMFNNKYGPVFKKIISCWKQQSGIF